MEFFRLIRLLTSEEFHKKRSHWKFLLAGTATYASKNFPLLEIACLLARLDHIGH